MMPSVNIELRTARVSDVPDLRRNWHLSFGDTDDYLDFFFSRRFVPAHTLVACVNGTVVSQLFLLAASLRTRDALLSADYLFAAATHPDYRGEGIMAALLRKAQTVCRERGKDAIALLPGTQRLYDYYAVNGFETAFFRRRWNVSRDELARFAAPVQTADNAISVLLKLQMRRSGLCWDAEALSYALDEHRMFRGQYAAGRNAFVSLSDEEAVCICAPEDFGECAALILDRSDASKFILLLPADLPFGTSEPGGMLCRLCEKPIHLRDAFISFAME